jgi:hypothetical protein
MKQPLQVKGTSMYNPETEVLFPSKAIGSLSSLRSKIWQDLVIQVQDCSVASPEQTAFLLMMIKIDGCTSCNVDSFRAMRGCPACALLNIRRYKGTDDELVRIYQQALKETKTFFEKNN